MVPTYEQLVADISKGDRVTVKKSGKTYECVSVDRVSSPAERTFRVRHGLKPCKRASATFMQLRNGDTYGPIRMLKEWTKLEATPKVVTVHRILDDGSRVAVRPLNQGGVHRIAIVLEVEGSKADALAAVTAALDDGALQDAIDGYEADDGLGLVCKSAVCRVQS